MLVGIAVPVQEERPSTCQHVHQRLSRCLRRQKSRRCSGLTRRQLPDGQRQENSRQSGHSAATAGTGRLRSAPFWRVSRSSARNEAWPRSGVAAPERLALSDAPSASGHLSCSWGGRPRRPAHRIGGRTSRSMRRWASVSESCRGRSGLLELAGDRDAVVEAAVSSRPLIKQGTGSFSPRARRRCEAGQVRQPRRSIRERQFDLLQCSFSQRSPFLSARSFSLGAVFVSSLRRAGRVRPGVSGSSQHGPGVRCGGNAM